MVRKIEKKDSVFKKPHEEMSLKDYFIFRKMSWSRSPLYKEITKVPLLVYVPGIKARQNNELISSVDIMPTVLDLAGIKTQSYTHGSSIMPLISSDKKSIRDFTVTSLPLYQSGEKSRVVDQVSRRIQESSPSTITDKEWTLLYTDKHSPVELYNIERDPGQLNNVYEKNIDTARNLHNKFYKLLTKIGTHKSLLEERDKLPL